jgi:hypothetical protein
MQRRQVITGFIGLAATTMVSRWESSPVGSSVYPLGGRILRDPPLLDPMRDREHLVTANVLSDDMDARDTQTMSAQPRSDTKAIMTAHAEKRVQVNKNIDYERDYDDDIMVELAEQPVLHSVFLRLKNLQKVIGYGHFNLLSFDDAIGYAKRFDKIGAFSSGELAFMEKIFSTNARLYGFYGDKVTSVLTDTIKKSAVIKISGSGHYLFKSQSQAYYEKLKKDVGSSIVLTSGIRSTVKQLYLFLAKTVSVNGNLSRASRSLAPPGYSYHGIGDFDVGRIDWGEKNFTDDFASTDEYKRMQDLGYIAIRYDQGNNLGVRFEPWHIKVV